MKVARSGAPHVEPDALPNIARHDRGIARRATCLRERQVAAALDLLADAPPGAEDRREDRAEAWR